MGEPAPPPCFAAATRQPVPLVGVQVLDGLGAGIFNLIWVLVAAGVSRGTGRFKFTRGLFGYPIAFVTLTGIAGIALALELIAMPETRRVTA
jgi:hypothetical protein